MPRYGTINRDYGMQLARSAAEAGGIYMLNLMKYRERAVYDDDGNAEVSGREADDRYAPIDVLAAIGASVCFLADVVDASEDWDRIAVVRYPTRRSFIDMQARDDFKDKHVHKEAGMDHTTIMGTLPMAGVPTAAKPSRLLLEAWKGAAPEPAAEGAAVAFEVEGTIIGDEREWSGVRYTTLADDAKVDVSIGTREYQLIVVQPTIERWQ